MDNEKHAWKSFHRGQHVRAWRKFGTFEHHGIVINKSDLKRIDSCMWPVQIEPILIVEQNVKGLKIVTIKEFCTDHLFGTFEYECNIVEYSATSEKLHLSRPGACRQRAKLSDDEIVENVIAILNNPQQRAIWKSYNLIVRNCEQFAVLCSTGLPSLGCQIPATIEGLKCLFVAGVRGGIKYLYNFLVGVTKKAILIGEKITPSAIASGAVMSIDDFITTCIQGNAIAAGISFGIEFLILSVRVLIYHFSSEENREKYLACKWAISWDDYKKRMFQAGFANCAAFGGSLIGLYLGAAFGGVPAIPLSILFGFIAYILGRWISGVGYDKVRQLIRSNNGQGYKQLNKTMCKISFQMNHIRHEETILSLRTSIRSLQIKASSLQEITTTIIKKIRSIAYNGIEERFSLQEMTDFIQRDLEYLYKQLNILSDQHDLISQKLEEIIFDNNNEQELVWNMMEDSGLALCEFRIRIEDLSEGLQSMFVLDKQTNRNEIFENILDSCDRLDHITNILTSE